MQILPETYADQLNLIIKNVVEIDSHLLNSQDEFFISEYEKLNEHQKEILFRLISRNSTKDKSWLRMNEIKWKFDEKIEVLFDGMTFFIDSEGCSLILLVDLLKKDEIVKTLDFLELSSYVFLNKLENWSE